MRRHDWEFYYHNSARSYRPGLESPLMAAAVSAVETARAVRWVWENGLYYVWEKDDFTEVQTDNGKWETLPAVQCALCISNEVNTEVYASLGGITESDDADVARDYRDVVEGDLAMEAFTERVLSDI